jgi:hypothetical protein
MTRLIVRRAAQLDVRSIREWYEVEEIGLGAPSGSAAEPNLAVRASQ